MRTTAPFARVLPLLALLAFGPAAVAHAEGPSPEGETLPVFAARLESALGKVSRGSVTLSFTAEAGRSYRLPGYGVMVLLAPRLLPARLGRRILLREQLRMRGVRGEGEVPDVRGDPASMSAASGDPASMSAASEEQELLALRAQAEAFHRQAERSRRMAQASLLQMIRELQAEGLPIALPVFEDAPGGTPPPGSPLLPLTGPAPSGGPPPLPPPPGSGSGEPPLPMQSGVAGPPPMPPPWSVWLEEDTEDPRPPERIYADVRAALTEALASGARPRGLAPGDSVVIAVDFLRQAGLPARTERTLVVRVRQADLNARAAGTLSRDELRARLEFGE